MRIICATDFTPRARSAAGVAIDLARAAGGTVELVHSAAPRSADIQALTVDVGVFEHEIRQGIKIKLEAEARDLSGPVLVTSFFGASDGTLGFVRRLRSGIACDVAFLRLYWPTEEYLRLGLTGSRDLVAPDPEVVADLERALRLHVGVLSGAGKTSYAVEPAWGDPASGLFVAAGEHDADLIVMGAESRSAMASRFASKLSCARSFLPTPSAKGSPPTSRWSTAGRLPKPSPRPPSGSRWMPSSSARTARAVG
jgi:nucleotide-binding universal stress UspA family protein